MKYSKLLTTCLRFRRLNTASSHPQAVAYLDLSDQKYELPMREQKNLKTTLLTFLDQSLPERQVGKTDQISLPTARHFAVTGAWLVEVQRLMECVRVYE